MAHGRGCRELLAPRNPSPYLRGGVREEGPGLLCAAPESPSAAGHRDGAGQGCGGGGSGPRPGAEPQRYLPAGTARYGSVQPGTARYGPARLGTARPGPPPGSRSPALPVRTRRRMRPAGFGGAQE